VLAAGTVTVLGACAPTQAAAPGLDIAPLISDFASALSANAPYRAPSQSEREDGAAALVSIAEGRVAASATKALERLGFTVSEHEDPVTQRRYALVVNERGTERAWGLYVIELGAAARVAVEVPHPGFDLHTEEIGVELHRRTAGSMLLVAGAHRRAADGEADVAHEEHSLFHAVATGLAGRGLPQVQLHGFHDGALPEVDVIVSAGAGEAAAEIRDAAARLGDAGFALCRAWAGKCGDLEGTRNVQGKAAQRLGTVFAHVELSRSVRDSPTRRVGVAGSLAAAFG